MKKYLKYETDDSYCFNRKLHIKTLLFSIILIILFCLSRVADPYLIFLNSFSFLRANYTSFSIFEQVLFSFAQESFFYFIDRMPRSSAFIKVSFNKADNYEVVLCHYEYQWQPPLIIQSLSRYFSRLQYL